MQGHPDWRDSGVMPPARGFEVYHKTTHRWDAPPLFHAHEFYEFFFFLRGAAHFVLDGRTYFLQPGDLLLFPVGGMHRAVIENEDIAYERAYFYVTPDFARGLGSKAFPLAEVIEGCAAREQLHFHLSDEEALRCREQIDAILLRAASEDPADQLAARHLFALLLIEVCRLLQRPGLGVSAPERSAMDDLLRYVQAHLCEPLDAEALAARFYMSKFYMLHRFKAHTGMSLHQYLLAQRVVLAQRLLPKGGPAAEIAARCGFADYSGFYRAFRKVTGTSPQQYLALLRDSGAPGGFAD